MLCRFRFYQQSEAIHPGNLYNLPRCYWTFTYCIPILPFNKNFSA